jgi:hypothetical protein
MTSRERLTAADRPGIAQPVPERPVPAQPWGRILATVAMLVLLATAVWEWRMRSLGLLPGDLLDNGSSWAEQRRRIDTGNVPVAIVGDSRILFDTDLDRFESLTGVRPVQLALAGTNARPFLENVAADPDFRGLLILGISELSYFRKEAGLNANALDRYRYESPAQRSSFLIQRQLSRVFGFLDAEYRLSKLVLRLDPGWRAGTRGPYNEPWKLSVVGPDRQVVMWSRIETDPYLNAHWRTLWLSNKDAPPIAEDIIEMTQRATRDAVAAIRARGGDVVVLRPPSRDQYHEIEDRRTPRARIWDPLLAAAGVQGLNADDDPLATQLFLPEMSHLSRACATVYTDDYVRRLTQLTPRLKLRTDAPPPLSPADCAPSAQALAVQAMLESAGETPGAR